MPPALPRDAVTDYPIHELLARRWSPYGFDPRPVPTDDLRSVFEAARWAPSAFNEQPWRYLVATRDDEVRFADMLTCLVETNQQWARHASALIIVVASLSFDRNGKPNRTALHDVGLASASLSLEATNRGLMVHQMSGILADRAQELYGIPEGFQATTAVAIGYAGGGPEVAETFRDRDEKPRLRRPQSAFVFAGEWGRTADL